MLSAVCVFLHSFRQILTVTDRGSTNEWDQYAFSPSLYKDAESEYLDEGPTQHFHRPARRTTSVIERESALQEQAVYVPPVAADLDAEEEWVGREDEGANSEEEEDEGDWGVMEV